MVVYYLKRSKSLVAIVCLVLVLIYNIFLNYSHQLLDRPIELSDKQAVVIIMQPGESATQLVNRLYQLEPFFSKTLLLTWMQLRGYATALQVGYYAVQSGDTRRDIIERIVRGDILVEVIHFIEGTSMYAVQKLVQNAPYLIKKHTVFTSLLKKYKNPEGLILANTYFYNAGSSAEDLIVRAHQELMTYLYAIWQTRAANLPYKSPYELLIAASIIEKETALVNERRLISGIIVNRLNHHMLLQMDPTVIYAKNTSKPLSHQDLLIDSPYNTYIYHGLPPTPIAIVGKSAIDAAAHPQASNYLYYVARGDGSHQFSEHYAGHIQAVRQFNNKRR